MTYPDREVRIRDRHWLTFTVVLLLLVYLAFAAEASFRNRVCISAATVDSTGTSTVTPVVCR